MAHAQQRILVAGATGYLGKHVICALAKRGFWVRALVRDPARLGDARKHCDDIVVGHATRADTLIGACDGVDGVFSCIGLGHVKRRPTIWDVDYRANLNLIIKAQRARIDHVVFVSIIGADRARGWLELAEARERIVDALFDSELGFTVLRPTNFFNDMGKLFAAIQRLSVAVVPGDGSRRTNPIHGADVAEEVAATFSAGPRRATRAIGGPDIFTVSDIARAAFDALGRRPIIIRAPFPAVTLARRAVYPWHRNLSSFIGLIETLKEADAVGECCGQHHLVDHFAQLASGRRPS